MARTITRVAAPSARQRSRESARLAHSVARALIYLALLAGAVWFLAPLLWMATSSVKPKADVYQYPPVLLPLPPRWSNYADLFAAWPVWTYLRNTLTITMPSVLGQVLSSSLVAYSFSRVRWPGRNVIFIVVLATLMLPFQVTMIPLYIIFRQFGWIGTFAPLIVPNFFASAFDIFLLRQFFLGIPGELTDAARIDGCGHLRIYWRIVLPLAKPALATVALFEFLNNWNDFLGPLIFLQDNSMYTLSLALQDFQSRYTPEPHLLMAASTLMVIPVIIIFFFTQRTFIQGITLTGLKG